MDAAGVTREGASAPAAGAAETSYVLITPARNEAACIEETIRSVVAQTRRPLRWVVVSDGSTDATDEIIARYAAKHDFIVALRHEGTPERSFASKCSAFRRGYEEVRHLPHAVVGNLDADVTLPPDYCERAVERMSRRPRLGVSGALYWTRSAAGLVRSRTRAHDTPGCVQLFRRQCYEDIGGYTPLQGGGEDTVAAVMARMAGWETRAFGEPRVVVRRPTGALHGETLLRIRFAEGVSNYGWGAHPVFMFAKAATRIPEWPYVSGSVALLGGYFSLWLRRAKRQVPDAVVRHVQREQLERLRSSFAWWRAPERDDGD